MRQKGKRKQRKPAFQKKIFIQCGEIVYKLPIRVLSETKTQEKFIVEIKEELEKIYSNYLNELSTRLRSLNFLSFSYEPQEFLYKIDLNKLVTLRAKLCKLLKNDGLKLLYYIFSITIHKFLSDIRKELFFYEEKPEELFILCIAESLNALECSAKELGKVTEKMSEHAEIESNCENITKEAFYEKILRPYEDLLVYYKSSCKCQMVQNIVILLSELNKCKTTQSLDLSSNSESSTDISMKSIEEIMNFIDGEKEKRKKKSDKMKDLDEEVERFKSQLENCRGEKVRLKPNLSNDWICGLKLRINSNRS